MSGARAMDGGLGAGVGTARVLNVIPRGPAVASQGPPLRLSTQRGHFPHVSGWLFPINVSKCIEVYRSVSYVYRDFLDTTLNTVLSHFLFDTCSIHTRYVLGAVGTSILYRFPIPFRYANDTSRILYCNK